MIAASTAPISPFQPVRIKHGKEPGEKVQSTKMITWYAAVKNLLREMEKKSWDALSLCQEGCFGSAEK